MRGFLLPASVLRVLVRLFAVMALLATIGESTAAGQLTNPIASRWANARVQGEEIPFLQRMGQITPEQAKLRIAAMNTELQAIRTLLNALPRQVQVDITQESERMFVARIIPLREQWKQALLEKAKEDQAADAQRRTELQADADVAGKLQAQRTLLRERAQRGEISQADMTRADREAEQQVLALHRKYDAYGPAWGRLFTQTEARVAAGAVATGRLRLRLDDTSTPLGRDAHRAAELTLSMQRNQLFQARQAMTPQEVQNLNATAQSLLTTLQQKYAASPDAADYRDRVVRLVQEGAAAQKAEWEREAVAAREALVSREAAAREAAARDAAAARGRAAAAAAAAPAVPPPPAVNPVFAPATTSPQRTPPNVVSAQPLPAPDLSAGAAAAGPAPAPPIASGAPGRSSGQQPSNARGRSRGGSGPPPPAVVPTIILAEPPEPTAGDGSIPWRLVIVVLLVGGVGTGVYVLRTRRASAPPKYAPPPYVEPPRVSQPPRRNPASPAPATPPVDRAQPGASLKERLFAEQREKYQSRYNEALDELTAASAALTELTPVLNATHANVQLLAKTLQNRLHALAVARSSSLPKLLMYAAILLPVWRLFKRSGILLKLLIGFLVWTFIAAVVQALTEGFPWVAVGTYLAAVVVAFFIERHFMHKAPLEVLKKQGGDLKAIGLSYAYPDQRAIVHEGMTVYRGVCVRASDATPTPREQLTPEVLGTGAFLVEVGHAAIYRMEPGGGVSLLSSSSQHPLITNYGDLLDQVMNDQSGFAAATLLPFAQYGQAMWRKQQAAGKLPQLEKLVKDVDRIEEIWRDTWISDAVFEFLFRAIDMFNMHDAATPPGLLLHGLPGNGKKHLAKKIAETISARFDHVTPSKVGSAERITELWKGARGTDPVVLFVPNAEAVFPKTPEGVSERDTLEWIAEWERHEPRESRVWVVMTAPSDEAVDPAILDHVGRDAQIEISGPDTDGRRSLFDMACRQYNVSTTPPESVVRATGGASIQDIRRIVTVAKRAASPQEPHENHWTQAVQTVRGVKAKIRDETKTWDRLVLPPKIKERLQVACKILQDAQEYMKMGAKVENILLYGPPGTGKTEIARTIANEGGVNFMDQKLSDLKGEYQGQSVQNVRRMFEKARGMAPTVLFIDEIDGVGQQRGGGGGDSYTQEITNELLQQMEGATKSDRPVFILAATNLPETLDRALLRRFQHKIEIPLPDEDARREILIRMLREKKLAPDLDPLELAAAVAKRTNGQSGAGLRDVVDRAVTRAVGLAKSPGQALLTRALVMDEVDELAKSSSDKVDESARWDSLVVSDETMAQLKELSNALRHMETFQRQGIDPPRGAVLYGPPGTGKTQIAKTLANESDVPFLFKTGTDLGASARQVRAVFDDARSKAPCILFLDEFENAGKSRDDTGGGSSEALLELLNQMQGAKKTDRPVFVLAATNYLDRLDGALLDRFDYKIHVPNPTAEQRQKLFTVALNRYPLAQFDVGALAAELARKGGGLSGREINGVVSRASKAAAQRALAAGTPENVVLMREDLVREVEDTIKRGSDAVDPTARWDTLVLSDETMNTLKQISRAVGKMEERLKRGLEPTRGAVLFGPPGTGKTQIARTLANESGVQFVSAAAKDLTGQYVGESTQKVAKLFADARKKAPCILFLDEFDSATGSRTGGGHTGSGFSSEVVPQVLAEMDGVKATGRPVFVLAATNHLEHVDEAVRDRFSYKVEIPSPTPEQRERIFAVFLKKLPRVDFQIHEMAAELVRRAGAISGRQIADLTRKAGELAADRAENAGTPEEILVTRDDLMGLLAPRGARVTEDDIATIWTEIILKSEVKQTLLDMIRLFNSGSRAAPKGLLLHGPSGTGKSEIGRLLARSTGCEFLKVDVTTLKGMHPGEGARRVKELWDKARVVGRAVIFVDECDGLFARRGGMNTDAAVEEVTNAFLPMWDGLDSKGQIWVVGATNKRDRIDGAIESRFGELIEIGLPDATERGQILALELKKLESAIAVPEFVGKATSGFAGRNLAKVAAAVFRLAGRNGGQATDEMWRRVIGQFTTATGDAVDPRARWNTLILQDALIKRLKRMSEMLKHAETLREQGIDPPRSALLFGPPGTGKTQIARTIANESGLNFIAAGPSDIKGAHLGESGRMVRELFERARAKPTILFIDEIEAGTPSRNGGRADQYTIEIVTELINQMEGVTSTAGSTVFVLAATNHPEVIDEALLSRFEERIEVPNPGFEERKRMIRTFISKRRVDFDVGGVAEEIAARSDGLSGRDLMSLVRLASQQSAERAIDAGTADQIVMTRADLIDQLDPTAGT